MSSTPPEVSVYLATRDRAPLLQRAARSILAQQDVRFELLIVDDGSRDATAQVMAELGAADDRVRTFHRSASGGPAVARNVALRAAQGEFVTGLDDDDEMLPGRLRALLDAYSDEWSQVCALDLLHGDGWLRPEPVGAEAIELAELLFRNRFTQMLTRRTRVLDAGWFDESMPAWEDYDLWTRLVLRHGPARRVNRHLGIRRVDSARARVTTSIRQREGAVIYYRKYSALMSAAQRRSHGLMQCYAEGRRIGLAEAWRLAGSGTWRRALQALVADRLPGARTLVEALRRRRWPVRTA